MAELAVWGDPYCKHTARFLSLLSSGVGSGAGGMRPSVVRGALLAVRAEQCCGGQEGLSHTDPGGRVGRAQEERAWGRECGSVEGLCPV